MKQLIYYTLLLGAGMFSTSQAAVTDSAYIEIRDIRQAGDPVLVLYKEDGENKSILLEKPVNGVYRFVIPAEPPHPIHIMVRNTHNMLIQGSSFRPKPRPSVMINPGARIAITIDSRDHLSLDLETDDPEVAYYERFGRLEREFLQKIWAQTVLREQPGSDTVQRSSSEQEMQVLQRSFAEAKIDFVSRSWDHYGGLEVFASYCMALDNRQAWDDLHRFSAALQETALWEDLRGKISTAGKVAVGQNIPYFSVKTGDGGTFESNALGGKYWLLDFWGSWCQPCRASHPDLLDMYHRYREQGFEILGIAQESGDVQRQHDQWIKAIEEDGIDWVHTLNTEENDVVKLFGVTSYPTKLLVNPEGRIIFRSGSSKEDLQKVLSAIFDQE